MKTLLPILLWALLPLAAVGQSPNVIARNCAFDSSEAIFDPGGRGSEEGGDGNVGNVSEVGTDAVPQAQLKIASQDARASHPSHDDDGGIASRDARASHPARDDVNGTTLRELGAPNVIARNCAFNSSEAIFNSDGRGSTDTVPQAQLKIASLDARASHPSREDVNATTLAVLLANRPKGMAEADWLKMMQEPVNRALFPLRVTQGMLDTLDGREMDLRFRYVLVGGR